MHRALDRDRAGGLEREPALARATRTRDRDEPDVRAREQRLDPCKISAAADEPMVQRGQGCAAERGERGKLSSSPGATSWKSA